MTKILLIDNYDSFTHILADLIYRAVGIAPVIVPNDQPRPEADLIFISPGPGHPANPQDIGTSHEALAGETPVIGVCLGHQAIALAAGCSVRRAEFPMHGLESQVHHSGTGVFADIPSPMKVIRYHSLDVTDPHGIEVLAYADDGTIMALRRLDKPQWGVQFHPESIGTEHGVQLIRQLIDATGVLTTWRREATQVVNPAALVHTWRNHYPYICWLDSANGAGMHLIGAGHNLVGPGDIPHGVLATDAAYAPVDFVPGALGVLPYEASAGIDGGELCEGEFLVPEVVYQLHGEQAWLLSETGSRLPELVAPPATAHVSTSISLRHNREEYCDLVRHCQEQIAAGESYELCLTTAAHAECEVDPFALYLQLRELAPAPMAGYFQGRAAVLSASPERFLSVRDGNVAACPIKGTRPRGATPEEDEQLRAELARSRKDRAENVMIVDLLRNDLARTCMPASIEVPELCEVYSFSCAHQMISTITGRLRPGLQALDALRAAFPGGSMTGAPKQRSMEILAQLEQTPRGYYSGILGYLSATGDADFSILIRSVIYHDGCLSYGAGGAITALSDPHAEFDEVLVKMKPFELLLGHPCR